MRLVDRRSGATLATDVEVAVTRAARRRGLLGRDRLDPSAALMLSPCWAVHTFFMRFAIDVIFVDDRGRVLQVAAHLGPWRLAARPGAHAVLELAAGAAEAAGVRPGDELNLVSDTPPEAASLRPALAP